MNIKLDIAGKKYEIELTEHFSEDFDETNYSYELWDVSDEAVEIGNEMDFDDWKEAAGFAMAHLIALVTNANSTQWQGGYGQAMDTEKNKPIKQNMALKKTLEEIADIASALSQQRNLHWQTQAKILLIYETATETLETNKEG